MLIVLNITEMSWNIYVNRQRLLTLQEWKSVDFDETMVPNNHFETYLW